MKINRLNCGTLDNYIRKQFRVWFLEGQYRLSNHSCLILHFFSVSELVSFRFTSSIKPCKNSSLSLSQYSPQYPRCTQSISKLEKNPTSWSLDLKGLSFRHPQYTAFQNRYRQPSPLQPTSFQHSSS